jgi:N6-L-threonylcarbamoyladenine synthase
MKILSIETSCDDTGIAILEVDSNGKFSVLANVIASQVEIGKKYGGVYPMMAKREHQKHLVPVLVKTLKEAELLSTSAQNISTENLETFKTILSHEPELLKKLIPFLKKYAKPDVDFIAVTNGPGLEPCLWVGVNFAKCLSYFWSIPIIPVNHVEAHILVNTFENPDIKFPAVSLVVSGGHTQLVLVSEIGKYKILGETRDDAAGECFDKCAKILGLGYPGGPIIAKLAKKALGGLTSQSLPRPMINSKDYDFSFSGLKTAVLYAWQKEQNKQNSKFFGLSQKTYYLKAMFAKEIQQAIIDVLIKKTMKAVKDFNAKSLILGGGVSANIELRKQFAEKVGNVDLIIPEPKLSTDNGLMIAVAGYFNRKKTVNWKSIQADGNLRIGEQS